MATSAAADARRLTDIVSRLRRALRRGVREELPWETLPVAQVELLQALADAGPLRVGELAAMRRLEPHTVSGLVQQLVTAHLVRRAADPDDRRAVLVSLTPTGRTRLEEWGAANARLVLDAFRRVTPDQRSAIRAALPALAALVAVLDDTGEA